MPVPSLNKKKGDANHLSYDYRAHSFPRKKFDETAENLVNSAAHRGKADEIPRFTAVYTVKFPWLD